MRTFKEYLSEKKYRYTAYALNQSNNIAKFLEYLNNDELDEFIPKQKSASLAIVQDNGNIVVYDDYNGKYIAQRKETIERTKIKFNKVPDVD